MTPTINPFPTIICPCGRHWTQEMHTVCPSCARWPSGNHSTQREIDLTTESANLREALKLALDIAEDLPHSLLCALDLDGVEQCNCPKSPDSPRMVRIRELAG